MSGLERVGDLEIDQNLGYARKAWRVQRAGWAGMALMVVGGLAGLFGNGPLAAAHVQARGVELEYDRLARYDASTSLEVQMAPVALVGDTARIWLDRRYMAEVEIEEIMPEPDRMATVGDTVWLEFLAGRATGPVRLKIDIRPRRAGLRTGHLGTAGGAAVEFRQFIYP